MAMDGVPAMPNISTVSDKKLTADEEKLQARFLKIQADLASQKDPAKLQASLDLIRTNFAAIIQQRYGKSINEILNGADPAALAKIISDLATIDALTQEKSTLSTIQAIVASYDAILNAGGEGAYLVGPSNHDFVLGQLGDVLNAPQNLDAIDPALGSVFFSMVVAPLQQIESGTNPITVADLEQLKVNMQSFIDTTASDPHVAQIQTLISPLFGLVSNLQQMMISSMQSLADSYHLQINNLQQQINTNLSSLNLTSATTDAELQALKASLLVQKAALEASTGLFDHLTPLEKALADELY